MGKNQTRDPSSLRGRYRLHNAAYFAISADGHRTGAAEGMERLDEHGLVSKHFLNHVGRISEA